MEYEVKTIYDRRGLRDFLRLPFRVYRGNSHWVPPIIAECRRTLDTSKNPYFADATLELFVCFCDGLPIARVALVISREHCRRFNVRTGFFGFFEALDDQDGVTRLFSAVERRCRERHIATLEGPFNPNHYSELGLLADRYDEDQGFFEPYNPQYYHRLLAGAGFEMAESLFTGRNSDVRGYLRQRYGPPPELPSAGEYVVRSFNLARMDQDLEKVREVFNDAFSSNWHFLPATAAEHRFAAKYLKVITRPELVTIVEHKGAPVGVLMCVLDINPLLRQMNGRVGPLKYLRFLAGKNRIRTLVVYAVGIRKGHKGTRVFTLLLESMRRMADSFDVMTCTWMHPGNLLSVATASRVGLIPDKQLQMYRKQIPIEEGGRR
jgi:hypothetical protein